MNKYNCNNTLDYAHEYERMCNIFRGCSGCPLCDLDCGVTEAITSEHIRRVQEWSDANPEPVLTDKQREILGALNLLGYKYIAQDSDGETYAFTERPRKWSVPAMWGGEGDCLKLKSKYHRTGVFDAISSLVSWNDKEPLNIEEVLKNGEKIL